MSHQPKVISNSNNTKLKNDETLNKSFNNREINQNLITINNNNNSIKKNCILNNNININSNTNSTSNNILNLISYFDRKYGEEENAFVINNVHTFGSNEMGQIGCDFDSKDLNLFSPIPIYLSELTNKSIISISAGDGHSVCVGKDGIVYAWGASACGQLGLDGNLTMYRDSEGYPYQPTPIPIKLISGNKIIEVSCGDAHTLALTKDGKIFSFGGAGCGQLGHPNIAEMPKDADNCPYQPYPRLIETLKMHTIVHIACGKAHSLCIDQTGNLYTWGAGACGQLGVEDISNLPVDDDGYFFQPVPKVLKSLKGKNIIHGVCGDVHTLVLTDKGEIYSFGGGSFGQLGLGPIKSMPLDSDNFAFMPIPTKIESLADINIVSIACGDSHSMAIDSDGKLYAWGAAACGQLGICGLEGGLSSFQKDSEGNPYEPEPRLITFFENMKVTSIACGEAHSLVLVEGGIVYSFGGNSTGQLGYPEIKDLKSNNKTVNKIQNLRSSEVFSNVGKPQLITTLLGKNVLKLACGGVHNLVLTSNKVDLANCLYKMYKEENLTDFEILIFNFEMNKINIKCHKIVLISRSNYFYNLIVKNNENVLELRKYNLLAFKTIIEYLYLDDISFLNEVNILEDLLEYFKIARLLELKTLQCEVENKLKSHLLKFSEALQNVVNTEDNAIGTLNNQNMKNYDQQFRGFYFLPNGACLMLLNEEVIEQVMKNSMIINFNQINHISTNMNPKDQVNINTTSNNNKFQSQKNSQDQVSNSKIGKFNKTITNSGSSSNTNNLFNQNRTSINYSNNSTNINTINQDQNRINNIMQNNTVNALSFNRPNFPNNNFINNNNNINLNNNNNQGSTLSANNLNRVNINNINNNLYELNSISSDSNSNKSNTSNLSGLSEKLKISSSLKNSKLQNENSNSITNEQGRVYDKNTMGKPYNIAHFSSNSGIVNNSFIGDYLNEEKQTLDIKESLGINNQKCLNNKITSKSDNDNSVIQYNYLESNSNKIINANIFEKDQLNDEVDISLNKANNNSNKTIKINDGKINDINNSLINNFLLENIMENQNLDNIKDFKGFFDVYNNIIKFNNIDFKDFFELLKKFSFISPYLNSNENLTFNNKYMQQNSSNKNDVLINENNKKNYCSNSSNLIPKSSLLNENSNINYYYNSNQFNGLMEIYPLGFDLLTHFNDKETSDLKILVGEYTFYVHKVILICRSKFFELMFNEEMKENTYNEVNISDYPPEEFFVFLLYLYSDQLQFNFEMALELLKAADMFAAENLRSKLELYLSSKLDVENSAKIFKFASSYNYEKLKKICLAFINDNYKQVIETQEFEDLQREYMLEIVRYCKTK